MPGVVDGAQDALTSEYGYGPAAMARGRRRCPYWPGRGRTVALHEIPVDDAPHTPTSECGCGPARVLRGGRYVYVHADQRPDNGGRPGDDEHDQGA